MKKIYLQPETQVITVGLRNTILDGSLTKYDTTVENDNGGWVKEKNDWDIWGNGSSDGDYEDEEY